MSNPTELPDLDRLEALARAATPQNLDSAQDATKPTGYIECPHCGGDGTVELTADYCNYDDKAMGVQFYGVGPEHQAAEAFFRAANPAAVLALIQLARRAQPEGEAPQAAPLSEVQIDRIARAHFSEQWAVQHAKDAIHDAFEDARKSATLSPLCGAQHAESGKGEFRTCCDHPDCPTCAGRGGFYRLAAQLDGGQEGSES